MLASLLQSPWNLFTENLFKTSYFNMKCCCIHCRRESAAAATVTVELTVVTKNDNEKAYTNKKGPQKRKLILKMLLIMKVMMIGEFKRVQR